MPENKSKDSSIGILNERLSRLTRDRLLRRAEKMQKDLADALARIEARNELISGMTENVRAMEQRVKQADAERAFTLKNAGTLMSKYIQVLILIKDARLATIYAIILAGIGLLGLVGALFVFEYHVFSGVLEWPWQ